MGQTDKGAAPATTGDEFVRMYPANQLKDQRRDPKETLSAFSVLKARFFDQ
jgi:hypothetical protein